MLSRWKKRADMDWEDIPASRAPARSSESMRYAYGENNNDPLVIPVRARMPAIPKRTVLGDIAHTSRVSSSV